MKNLILFSLIIAAVTAGCKKDPQTNPEAPRRCYECEINKSIQRDNGMATANEQTFKSYCDQKPEDIKRIEQAGTYTRNEVEFTRLVLVTSKTVCK